MVIAAATATPSINLTRSRMSLPPFCKLHMRRFTPESGQIADVSGCPLCANSDGTQRSKNLYSVTSSAGGSRVGGTARGIRGTGFMEYLVPGRTGSVGLDIGRPDHLAPLLGFVSDELAEVGGRARKHRVAQIGDARLDLDVGEAGIDLAVEFIDDLGGRTLGRTNAEPPAGFEAGQEIAHSGDVGQCIRTVCRRHRQCPQLAGLDVRDR